ncbi:hypothetical protein AVEN_197832-1 [Araneus ventricosus]|uniref:RNase H type-1 domain-containing protein n=1 Tax=Araneus ventricosus TaxID=182803 RepID=A0A4Y2WH78_ARAVE|nr:hypothetical protein AVEN_197832-1 [Araneus ventricosus]
MSALETLSHYDNRIHPIALEILSVLQCLRNKGFSIIFCWVPSHVDISGNETADVIARFASDFLPRALPYCDIKKSLVSHLLSAWKQKWDLFTNNKLYSVKHQLVCGLPFLCESTPVSNSSNVKTTSNKTPSTSNSISSSKSNSSPLKLNVKTNRKIKKQNKKSNELEKAKESKSAKRARILAAKRDQDVSQRSPSRKGLAKNGSCSIKPQTTNQPSRKDFLKDSLQEDNNEDDSDSDSLLKFHPSEDGMSTSEVYDILPSS